MKKSYFSKYFDDLSILLSGNDSNNLGELSNELVNIRRGKGKIILAGNGGSASIASHAAVDLTKAGKIRAINFNEPNLITCFANDFGYENWLSEAIKAYADSGDLIILISSSGQSKNILNAAHAAEDLKLKIVTFSGFLEENPLRKLGHLNYYANSSSYNYVEMIHYIWLLSAIDLAISIQ
ncbi:SIS domain-containing protein [Polynucleobacter sp. IMCC30063]|uniref:SIS domain-containing protein n=1 Tax=Polynucleobacter sp. IMCC30063 TaxID=2907298 RepID=UPI001F30327F|nr:SIS domain-containing protein [Polynucleobacter sp. IMCC30063]MCE7505304.1 SIS domain-containing protein [Polynucleobacter sp. IMCC30063]